MHKPTIEEILAPKPQPRPRINAYSFDDKAHKGLTHYGLYNTVSPRQFQNFK